MHVRIDSADKKTPVTTTAIKVEEKACLEAFIKSSSSYQSLIAHFTSGECNDSGKTWISPRCASLRRRLPPLLQICVQGPYHCGSGRVRSWDCGMLCKGSDRAGRCCEPAAMHSGSRSWGRFGESDVVQVGIYWT